MICRYCGYELKEKDHICPKCGKLNPAEDGIGFWDMVTTHKGELTTKYYNDPKGETGTKQENKLKGNQSRTGGKSFVIALAVWSTCICIFCTAFLYAGLQKKQKELLEEAAYQETVFEEQIEQMKRQLFDGSYRIRLGIDYEGDQAGSPVLFLEPMSFRGENMPDNMDEVENMTEEPKEQRNEDQKNEQ